MGGRQIIRIENSDSDLRFRDKVNRNFSTLMQSTPVERAASDPAVIENIVIVLGNKASQGELDALEDRVAELEKGTQGTIVTVSSINVSPGGEHPGSVTFPVPFATVPSVVLTTDAPSKVASIVSTSETGFSYKITNTHASSVMTAFTLYWIAVI